MSDGTEITGNSEEEIGIALRNWQMDNPNSDFEPSLQFPVDLVYVDGTIVTVNDDLELTNAYRACFGETDRDECFDILFPLTFQFPDGTTVTGNRAEIGAAIDAWYAENPNADQRPVMIYPFDIQYEDGTIVTINSDMELRLAYGDCDD